MCLATIVTLSLPWFPDQQIAMPTMLRPSHLQLSAFLTNLLPLTHLRSTLIQHHRMQPRCLYIQYEVLLLYEKQTPENPSFLCLPEMHHAYTF